jgi:hypothetical protein
MKNTFFIATAAALAGTAVAIYFRRRKRNTNVRLIPENPRPHHITSVFADAKKNMSHVKPDEV